MGGFVPQYESDDYLDPRLFGKTGHERVVLRLDKWYEQRPLDARFASPTCAAIESERRGGRGFYHVTTWQGGERSDFKLARHAPGSMAGCRWTQARDLSGYERAGKTEGA